MQRYQLFLLLLAGSAVLLALAVFVFLPLAVVYPQKLAGAVTLGSLMFMTAFAILRGPRTTCSALLSPQRAAFSISYVLSLLLTLYAVMVLHSYLLCVLALTGQLCALGYYGASYLPGGTTGMSVLLRTVFSGCTSGASFMTRGMLRLMLRG